MSILSQINLFYFEFKINNKQQLTGREGTQTVTAEILLTNLIRTPQICETNPEASTARFKTVFPSV